jgi:hypothetical protein
VEVRAVIRNGQLEVAHEQLAGQIISGNQKGKFQ